MKLRKTDGIVKDLSKKLTLSCSLIVPNSLKTLNGRFGGCLNGSEPKLNRHCWKDMKEAAGKSPVLKNNIKWCQNSFLREINSPQILENIFQFHIRFNSIKTENNFFCVDVDETSADASRLPRWQVDWHWLCVVPHELSATVEWDTVSVITDAIPVIWQEMRWFLRPVRKFQIKFQRKKNTKFIDFCFF